MIEIRVLPAYHGDSIIIHEKKENCTTNILIDGGIVANYKILKQQVLQIINNNEFIDLLVLTHIDEDHILGLIQLFRDNDINKNAIKKVWFNSGRTLSHFFHTRVNSEHDISILSNQDRNVSYNQAETLEDLLQSYNIWDKNDLISVSKYPYNFKNFSLTILSPDKSALKTLHDKWPIKKEKSTKTSNNQTDYCYSIEELLQRKFTQDSSIFNASSIGFILEISKKKLLLLGDAIPSIVENSIRNLGFSETKKLKIDICKLSHHASKNNTNVNLLKLLDCKKYIISSNGSQHGLPNKECLARVITNQENTELFFNYKINNIFTQVEQKVYKFNCKYLNETEYILNL